MVGISPNFVTNTSVGTFSVLKRSRTSVGKYIYDFRRGEAELRISTILGEAKLSYVYQNPFQLHGCLLCWARELTKLPRSEPVMTPLGHRLCYKQIYITISIVTSVCPCVRTCVRHKIFFSLKSPWNHPLTPGVDHRG